MLGHPARKYMVRYTDDVYFEHGKKYIKVKVILVQNRILGNGTKKFFENNCSW